jgi:hypothetical protein
MESYLLLFIILLLATVSYHYEKKAVPCKNNKLKTATNIFIFLHHCLVIFGVIGFFKYPFITLTLRLGLIIHWVTNNNRCFATVVRNKACGYDEGKLFHNIQMANNLKYLPFFIGIFFTDKKLEYVYMLILFFIVKLFYNIKYSDENKMRRLL